MKIGDTKFNDYGDTLVLADVIETRETAAYVSARNGAWLVHVTGELTGDATPDECYDAAGNLRTAKRLAREMATAFGYCGAARWESQLDGRLHVLTMTERHERWRYKDDFDEDDDD